MVWGYWSGGDGCSDEGRFAPLWAEDESHEEKIPRGAGLLVDRPDFRFGEGNTGRTRGEHAAEQKVAANEAAAQGDAAHEEAALAAALAAAQRTGST